MGNFMGGLALGILGVLLYVLSNLFFEYPKPGEEKRKFPPTHTIMRALAYLFFVLGAIYLILDFF